jgi:hypothetical protein
MIFLIGESKYETLKWRVKGDTKGQVPLMDVEIIDKKTGKVITTEELGSMIDYSFRHTDYNNAHSESKEET